MYGQNNGIIKTISLENIALNSRTFEGTRTEKSNLRTCANHDGKPLNGSLALHDPTAGISL